MSESLSASLSANQKFCLGCAKPLHISARSCPACGAEQQVRSAVARQKTRVAAILLAFFLGGIGLHKFYLGRVGQGILYIVFCWTFIPSIVALIEVIIYLTMTDEAFAEKYG